MQCKAMVVVGELEQFTCCANRIVSITLIVHNTPFASHGQAQKGCVVAALSYTEEIIQDRQPCINTAQDRFRCRSRSSPKSSVRLMRGLDAEFGRRARLGGIVVGATR